MKELRRFAKYFLPLLFIFYFGGISLFTHSHVVNGQTIVHSHPFAKQQTHSTEQMVTIAIVSHYICPSVPLFFFAIVQPLIFLFLLEVDIKERLWNAMAYCISPLRAPPVIR